MSLAGSVLPPLGSGFQHWASTGGKGLLLLLEVPYGTFASSVLAGHSYHSAEPDGTGPLVRVLRISCRIWILLVLKLDSLHANW